MKTSKENLETSAVDDILCSNLAKSNGMYPSLLLPKMGAHAAEQATDGGGMGVVEGGGERFIYA